MGMDKHWKENCPWSSNRKEENNIKFDTSIWASSSKLLPSILIAILTVMTLIAQAKAEISRPRYSVLPYTEDWSVLANKEQLKTGDFFDSLKYIPLNRNGSIWLSLGGEERIRIERWDDFQFGSVEPNDDTFILNRVRMHADWHLGPYVRLYVGGKSGVTGAQDLPEEIGPRIEDKLALQNAFADLILPLTGIFGEDSELTLRVGRHAMMRGNMRFIGHRNFSQVLQTFDGMSAILSVGDWRISAFGLRLVEVRPDAFNTVKLPDDGMGFFGIYSEGHVPRFLSNGLGLEPIGLDLYALRRDEDVAFNRTAGAEDRYAVGGRLYGRFPNPAFRYEIEGAYEFGEVNQGASQGRDADINASMFVVELGYQPKQPTALASGLVNLKGIEIGLDYASGDDSPGGNVQTFDPMFPNRYDFLGFQDRIGRFNILDLRPRVDFRLGSTDDVRFSLAQHAFWRPERQDALYSPAGGVVAKGGKQTDKFAGTETDVTLKYQVDRHLAIQTGYSHFFTGDFLNNSGLSQDLDWFYWMMSYTL